MTKILSKTVLAKNIFEMIVEAPRVAAKAEAGHFVIVMAEETGERIPLTIADYDRPQGALTLVFMVVGKSTLKLAQREAGGELYALLGPLGHASAIDGGGTVVLVAGGVGTAPVFPIARGFRERGARVISIQGARTKELIFWQHKLASVSDEHILMTDDGTAGRKGLVTEPLKEVLARDPAHQVKRVYAIGPTVMMRACCDVTRPFAVPTLASLNTIMVDGTGMCGGCRVNVGGRTLFTCVDGPEFDGHQVDWPLLLSRQKIYHSEEKCALDRYVAEGPGR